MIVSWIVWTVSINCAVQRKRNISAHFDCGYALISGPSSLQFRSTTFWIRSNYPWITFRSSLSFFFDFGKSFLCTKNSSVSKQSPASCWASLLTAVNSHWPQRGPPLSCVVLQRCIWWVPTLCRLQLAHTAPPAGSAHWLPPAQDLTTPPANQLLWSLEEKKKKHKTIMWITNNDTVYSLVLVSLCA